MPILYILNSKDDSWIWIHIKAHIKRQGPFYSLANASRVYKILNLNRDSGTHWKHDLKSTRLNLQSGENDIGGQFLEDSHVYQPPNRFKQVY